MGIQDERHHVGRRADDGRVTWCSAAARKATSSRSTRGPERCCGRRPLGGQVNAGPMSYSVGGKQYVTIAAGNALFAFALPQGQ